MDATADTDGAGVILDDPVMSAARFSSPLCLNCGVPRTTPYCGACGQKAARRLTLRDVAKESWERLRVFEESSATTLWKLVLSPGIVARDYVRGRRAGYMHPLKLLVALVALLVLVLAANQYFAHFDLARPDQDVDRMAGRVLAYANWSFTLGILAIFLGSWTVFRRRLGYNATEHGVLAVYAQNLILGLAILNLLPTLAFRDPAFVLAHKQASAWYLYGLKLGVVALAYAQFFRLRLSSDWPRLVLACLVYLATSWLLLRLYAAAILWFVTHT